LFGTPLYRAPEVQSGNYSLSVDIYSFGLVAEKRTKVEELVCDCCFFSPVFKYSLSQSPHYPAYKLLFRTEVLRIWLDRVIPQPEQQHKITRRNLNCTDILCNVSAIRDLTYQSEVASSGERSHRASFNTYLCISSMENDHPGLSWWRSYGKHYPLLAQVARCYLAICCTESECERMG
jgi:serine/threonine protein kinase